MWSKIKNKRQSIRTLVDIGVCTSIHPYMHACRQTDRPTYMWLCARANQSILRAKAQTWLFCTASLSFSERHATFCIHVLLKREQPWCSCQQFSALVVRRSFSCFFSNFWCCSWLEERGFPHFPQWCDICDMWPRISSQPGRCTWLGAHETDVPGPEVTGSRGLYLCGVTWNHRSLFLTCAQVKLTIPTDAMAVEFFVSYLTGPLVLLDFYHFCDSDNSFGFDTEHAPRRFFLQIDFSIFCSSSA